MALGFYVGNFPLDEPHFIPIGTTYNFSYTGKVDVLECPASGLYLFTLYGAASSKWQGTAYGSGGVTKVHKYIKKGTKIYICCGGTNSTTSGGYNGGGNGLYVGGSYAHYGTGGAGATHIALVNGLLKDIGYTSFVTNGNGIAVAGGGGGGYYNGYNGYSYNGGSGGGANGGAGSAYSGSAKGGGQTSGNAFGQGGSPSGSSGARGGGGGGLYGGYTAASGEYCAGGGGSGYYCGNAYITYRGVSYANSTSTGGNTSNGATGKASIKLVAY